MSTSNQTVPLPKWFVTGITLGPSVTFVITMAICISLVQQRGNKVFQYQLKDFFLANDISAYGIDSPEFVVFSIGFTLFSIMVTGLMYLRYRMWTIYLPTEKRYCSLNGIALMVGCLQAPTLIVMGWTNGKYGQRVHFPAALFGFGVLYLYSILYFCLDVQLLKRCQPDSSRNDENCLFLSKRQSDCVKVEIAGLVVIIIFVPLCIVLWLFTGSSWCEWMAAFLLLSSTVPAVATFSALPSSHYAAGCFRDNTQDNLENDSVEEQATNQPSNSV